MAASNPAPVSSNSELRTEGPSTVVAVLSQLGMIATPAGIIALFCQVLSVSSQGTAAASLAATFLASICVYRKLINQYIPATILLALLIALGTVFFLNYQNLLLKDTGLLKYYHHSNDFLAQVDPYINGSQQQIWFVGTNFNITAGERRTILLQRLEAGREVRFLIFDPRSVHLQDLARDFDQSVAELRSECDKGIQSLLELRNQWAGKSKSVQHPGELSIKVFDTHPHARFYIFDPDRKEGRTFFIPYINDINSPEVPGFLLQNTDAGVFKAYFGGVQKLWTQATTLDEYLKVHPDVSASI